LVPFKFFPVHQSSIASSFDAAVPTVAIYRKGDETDCSNYRGISLLSTSYKIFSNILSSRLSPYEKKLLGTFSVDFDATDQLLIRYFCIRHILDKKMGISIVVIFLLGRIYHFSVRLQTERFLGVSSVSPGELRNNRHVKSYHDCLLPNPNNSLFIIFSSDTL
jgi:hypothetical protein